ncbi:MAG: phage major capsid protein [Clostridium celatum]|nr:phage major capsid protein [Clostridium celatum]
MKNLVEKRNALIEEMEAMVGTAEAETRAFNEEELAKIEAIKAEIGAIDNTIKTKEEARSLEKIERSEVNVMENTELREFEEVLRGKRALTEGGLIPTSVAEQIIAKVKDQCPVLEKATVYSVKGDLNIVAENGDLNVAYMDDFQELSDASVPMKTIKLENFMMGALVKVSKKLINNVEFDIVSYVIDLMARNIARALNKEFVVGTPEKVEGLVSCTKEVVTATVGKVALGDLVDAQGQIPTAYQENACWILSPSAFASIRKEALTSGLMVVDGAIKGMGYALLGKPVYVDENLEAVATGKNVAIYGDLTGYAIKMPSEIEIMHLREKFATQGAEGVVGTVCVDGAIANQDKFVRIKVK